jgi:hypothetical protein
MVEFTGMVRLDAMALHRDGHSRTSCWSQRGLILLNASRTCGVENITCCMWYYFLGGAKSPVDFCQPGGVPLG